MSSSKRPVGRPPGVSGEDTRALIISAARSCFAVSGYSAATFRMIAHQSGLSSAALYHHFGKKQDLMLAVHEASTQWYIAQLQAAVTEVDGFIAKVQALLDVVCTVVRDDPEQALFAGMARQEAMRHPELAPILEDWGHEALYREIVAEGLRTGELHESDQIYAAGAIATVALGLVVSAGHGSVDAHAILTDGCKRLFAGQLISPRDGER